MLILNRWRILFQSSRVKLPFVSMSASWFLVQERRCEHQRNARAFNRRPNNGHATYSASRTGVKRSHGHWYNSSDATDAPTELTGSASSTSTLATTMGNTDARVKNPTSATGKAAEEQGGDENPTDHRAILFRLRRGLAVHQWFGNK